MTRKVHITLQGKGGVGKSFVAALIAQSYLRTGKAEHLACVDTDPVNSTLSGYPALRARRLELLQDNRVHERNFDQLMEAVLTEDKNFVIDNGASSFIPLSSYIMENNAVALITEAGKRVVIHTVVTGGQALLDTLQGFDALATQLPKEAELILWLNEFFGDIATPDGKPFEQMQVYERHKERINGLVRIPRQTSDTFGQDMKMLLDRKLTFDEATKHADFSLMAKQRLTMIGRTIFQQLEHVM